jgi:hypothetical protein
MKLEHAADAMSVFENLNWREHFDKTGNRTHE